MSRLPTSPLGWPDDEDSDELRLIRQDIEDDDEPVRRETRVARQQWWPDGAPREVLLLHDVRRAPQKLSAASPPMPAGPQRDTREWHPDEQRAASLIVLLLLVGGVTGYAAGGTLGAILGALAGLLIGTTLVDGAGDVRQRARSLVLLAILLLLVSAGAFLGQRLGGSTGAAVGLLLAGTVGLALSPRE